MAYRKADGTIDPGGFDPGLDYRVKQLEGLHNTGVDRIRKLEVANKRLKIELVEARAEKEQMMKAIKTISSERMNAVDDGIMSWDDIHDFKRGTKK